MKRLIILLLVVFTLNLFLVSGVEEGNKKKISFTVGAGIRGIKADHFSDIFSGTNLCYSIDFALRIMKSAEIFLHSDYLSIEGEVEYTKDKTTFSMIPAELGFRFLLAQKRIVPYLGAGGGYYSYKDEHPRKGELSEGKIGFFGEGGFKIYLSKAFFFDLKFKYIFLKSDNDIDLGGISYLGGIGIRF